MSESGEKTYGRLRTVTEAAEWLGRKPRTLREWIQRGLIESHKLFGCRMISEEEIIRLIEESRVPARGEKRPRVDVVQTPTRGRGSR